MALIELPKDPLPGGITFDRGALVWSRSENSSIINPTAVSTGHAISTTAATSAGWSRRWKLNSVSHLKFIIAKRLLIVTGRHVVFTVIMWCDYTELSWLDT